MVKTTSTHMLAGGNQLDKKGQICLITNAQPRIKLNLGNVLNNYVTRVNDEPALTSDTRTRHTTLVGGHNVSNGAGVLKMTGSPY